MLTGKKLCCLTMALVMLCGTSVVSKAADYGDKDEITSHVNLKTLRQLSIGRPAGEGSTTANNYFIMGSSDPDLPLEVNGQTITTRGAQGSFGVFVQLQSGVNQFRFVQGEQSAKVSIRKGVSLTSAKINTLRSMVPSYDCATYTGETITLSCVGPAGATISATIAGQTVALTQAVQAENGTPADFRATMKAPAVSETKNLGKVTYTMSYNGKTTSQSSEGSVFVTGTESTLVVQVKNNASCIYTGDDMAYYESVAKIGAVDYVTEIGRTCYRLSSGGWIPKETVTPLTGTIAVKNKVTKAELETSSRGETLRLTGTTHPMFRAKQENGALVVRFFNTTGVPTPDMDDSRLFSRAKIEAQDGATTITFTPGGTEELWGYDITYKNGVTSIYLKYAPTLGSGSTPLSGVTIAVDAGHGGSDPGALGFPMSKGATEAQINLASAIAVQKRLESLGAEVVMMRTEEEDLTMNDRMTMTRKEDADFFISLHSNSAGYEVDGTKTAGVEAYYYFDTSKAFATYAAKNVSKETGRQARGAKMSNFRVTLNTFCPSILLEMGFLTNPKEYDSMITKNGIYALANAVSDSVLQTLS